jgi:hypothetical protein
MMAPTASDIRTDALRRWIWVGIFAVAFAWVESAVVVYLREIYFDGGFSFPLVVKWEGGKHIIDPLVHIEFAREIATIVMLIAAGCLAGRNSFQKFCFFMIAFGWWDIFYYIWLYVMVRWPDGLMTWDLLFYVPVPWVGPVITPILIALAMIVAGSVIIFLQERGFTIRWRWFDLIIELGFGLLLIVAFCWDWKNIIQLPGNTEHTGIPNPFAWWLYLPAYGLALIYFAVRMTKVVHHPHAIDRQGNTE